MAGLSRNRYHGICHECRRVVDAQQGWVQRVGHRWLTWCENCNPDRPVRKLHADGTIQVPYEPQHLDLIRSLPEARWDGTVWHVAVDPKNLPAVLDAATILKLEIAPELYRLKCSGGLYPYQVVGTNWLRSRQKALLGDEMGLGKTAQTLNALPLDSRTLVVCPNSIKYNWKQEAQTWRPDLRPVVLERDFRFPEPGEIVITNYESIPESFLPPAAVSKSQVRQWREALKSAHPFADTILVADEAHKLKNYKTKRSQKFREMARFAGRVWALTGTPFEGKPAYLYGVLDSAGMAREVFTPRPTQKGSYSRFCELFGGTKTRWGMKFGDPDPEVRDLLGRVMLRRTRTEVLPDLPDKTITNIVVGPTDRDLIQLLDEIWMGHGPKFKDALPDFMDFSKVRARLAHDRVPAALEYAEDCEEQEVPLVVFSSHLSVTDAFLGRPGWGVITGAAAPEVRQKIVNSFQAGRLKGVALTNQVGGVGINLTHAWKALFVDLDWTPSGNSQAESRLQRIGQTRKVEIVRMVTDHPLDLHVHRVLSRMIAKTQLVL